MTRQTRPCQCGCGQTIVRMGRRSARMWAQRRFFSPACHGRYRKAHRITGPARHQPKLPKLPLVVREARVTMPQPGDGPAIRKVNRAAVISCRKCQGTSLAWHDLGMQCWTCRTIMYTQDGDWQSELWRARAVSVLG